MQIAFELLTCARLQTCVTTALSPDHDGKDKIIQLVLPFATAPCHSTAAVAAGSTAAGEAACLLEHLIVG